MVYLCYFSVKEWYKVAYNLRGKQFSPTESKLSQQNIHPFPHLTNYIIRDKANMMRKGVDKRNLIITSITYLYIFWTPKDFRLGLHSTQILYCSLVFLTIKIFFFFSNNTNFLILILNLKFKIFSECFYCIIFALGSYIIACLHIVSTTF